MRLRPLQAYRHKIHQDELAPHPTQEKALAGLNEALFRQQKWEDLAARSAATSRCVRTGGLTLKRGS